MNSFLDTIITKFKGGKDVKFKGGKDVKFKVICNVTDVYVEIERGVFIKAIDRTPNYIKLHCYMLDGAILYTHKHSDYNEHFQITYGELIEIESQDRVTDTYEVKANTWHGFKAIGRCEMDIDCYAIINQVAS